MFNFGNQEEIKMIIAQGAAKQMTDIRFIAKEIDSFINSQARKLMIQGEEYYRGKHDILLKTRTSIGEGGARVELDNLPNNKIVDNQYKKMVVQKKNYLLGKPLTVQTEDEQYTAYLNAIFDKNFFRTLKNVGQGALNCGLGWIFIGYDENGELMFKRIPASEIKPYWKDAEHTKLECAIRVYEVLSYEGEMEKTIHKVEVYEETGITYFEYQYGSLTPVEPWHTNYMSVEQDGQERALNWLKIPLVAFKYNSTETPLIKSVKSLQDGLNKIESAFEDNMEEDARNTIMVLVNYDGQDLGEFRRNLATYGAVKVRSTEGSNGDVKTLQVDVNSENYKAIIEIFKKAIIENAMGYDAKDDRLSGNANQMNIQSMYSDIDLEANDMEMEFQYSIDELLWFVDCHLANCGYGDYSDVPVDIRFNRDILMNAGEAIDNCAKSVGLLSSKTILAHHPFVTDPDSELAQLEEEKKVSMETFGFGEVKEPEE